MSRASLAYAPKALRGKSPITPAEREFIATQRELQKTEAREVMEAVADTVARALDRGEEITKPIEARGRYQPPKKLDGLAFLFNAERLTLQQLDAGRKFESLYVILYSGDVRSCLAAMEVRSQTQRLTHSEAKVYARAKLDEVEHAVGRHTGMWGALVMICGEGMKPSTAGKARRAADRIESQLDCALSILVKHWGM